MSSSTSPSPPPVGVTYIDPDLFLAPDDPAVPNCDLLITEDDTAVDNLLSEKQMRLLTEPLHSNWEPGRPFAAMANVGFFHIFPNQATVPDMLLSMDVVVPQDQTPKENRSYFMWKYGKPPEAVIEIVSNKVGEEAGKKLKIYESVRVTNYIIFDPMRQLSDEVLRRFELQGTSYQPVQPSDSVLLGLELKLVLWSGRFEDMDTTWVRWAGADGELIPTGAEQTKIERSRAEAETKRAEVESQRAEAESQRADDNQRRIDELETYLRKQGIEPPSL